MSDPWIKVNWTLTRRRWQEWTLASSVQFSLSVVSNSLRPHESQHARPPCRSPFPGVHSNSHPLSRWCHPDISSTVVPFYSCSQSLPASESFLMSQLFSWGGQSTRVSALALFFPKNTQGWSPLEYDPKPLQLKKKKVSRYLRWRNLHGLGKSSQKLFSNQC